MPLEVAAADEDETIFVDSHGCGVAGRGVGGDGGGGGGGAGGSEGGAVDEEEAEAAAGGGLAAVRESKGRESRHT